MNTAWWTAAAAAMVLADTGPREATGPTDREVLERSRDWELLPDGDGFELRSDHFALRGCDGDELRLAAVHAEAVVEALQVLLGGDASEHLLRLRIAGPDPLLPPWSYDEARFEAVVRRAPNRGRELIARHIRRALTLHYLHRLFGPRDPWFAEGLGAWIERSTWKDGRIKPQAIRLEGSRTPLRRLLEATRHALRGEDGAQAACLVAFLAAKDPALLPRLADGAPLADLLDLARLEKAWANP
jgi:hypothetical protein